ncbi:HNH endonuclease [Isoptericola sp. b408]|uniref:HNH endonuclease n=1 Tax=Isoptericola sp. b408 TaxID=3064653 RepID=UPI002712DB33|nr:HNH endonuclease [Isoptericola sp. b408]MDO8150196.1 hypothetical protein [Isoptericola sp. b408]
MSFTEADYLDLRHSQAMNQWRGILSRSWPVNGRRQVAFVPVETLLCLAAMFVVEHSRYGSGSAHRAPEPVQALSRLFKRPATSVIAKMNNLDGSRSHGARHDLRVGSVLRTDLEAMADIYRTILSAGRSVGVDSSALPDFLGLEAAGDLVLLGQEELEPSAVESVIEREIQRWLVDGVEERETERTMMASLRVGQHRFARGVLASWSHECAFCGFSLGDQSGPSLLRASHIKPWRDSDPRERLDIRNGFAACAAHDAAFDAGLLTVSDALEVRISARLAAAIETNEAARTYFTEPHLRRHVAAPDASAGPSKIYLTWHQSRVFESTSRGA